MKSIFIANYGKCLGVLIKLLAKSLASGRDNYKSVLLICIVISLFSSVCLSVAFVYFLLTPIYLLPLCLYFCVPYYYLFVGKSVWPSLLLSFDYVCLCLLSSLIASYSLCVSVTLCIGHSLPLSLFVCLFPAMSVCLSLSIYISLSLSIFVCLSHSIYICLFLSLYVCLSLSLYVCLFACLSISVQMAYFAFVQTLLSLCFSVTRWLDYIFNIWLFTPMKICPIA